MAGREGSVRATFPLAALLAAGLSSTVAAQSYRTMVETRRVEAGRPLRVEVEFAVGELLVRPADGSRTYRVGLTYAEDVFTPQVRFDQGAGLLSVRLDGEEHLNLDDVDASDQQLDLGLPRDVPLDLALSFGAIEAEIELGELMLRSAEFKTGASEAVVTFSSPTTGSCDRLAFNVGAAQFEARNLGNSGCRVIELRGAVGEMELDLSGERLDGVSRLVVKVGLGEVRLLVPEEVGISLDTDRFLASVTRAGLVKQGSAFVSPGFDRARAKLHIEVDAALGSVEIERTR
jgi:hypothetical protein